MSWCTSVVIGGRCGRGRFVVIIIIVIVGYCGRADDHGRADGHAPHPVIVVAPGPVVAAVVRGRVIDRGRVVAATGATDPADTADTTDTTDTADTTYTAYTAYSTNATDTTRAADSACAPLRAHRLHQTEAGPLRAVRLCRRPPAPAPAGSCEGAPDAGTVSRVAVMGVLGRLENPPLEAGPPREKPPPPRPPPPRPLRGLLRCCRPSRQCCREDSGQGPRTRFGNAFHGFTSPEAAVPAMRHRVEHLHCKGNTCVHPWAATSWKVVPVNFGLVFQSEMSASNLGLSGASL